MAKKGLAQANILRSNNTTSTGYGIVYANEISGHRTVADLYALYALFDWQLSASGNNTDNDAIGQLWYVVDTDGNGNGNLYQLINWENRNKADGWKVFTANSSVDLSNYQTTAQADSKYATKESLSGYATTAALSETRNELNDSISGCVKNTELGSISNTEVDNIWNNTQQAS